MVLQIPSDFSVIMTPLPSHHPFHSTPPILFQHEMLLIHKFLTFGK